MLDMAHVQYIIHTLRLAIPSLTINGFDASSSLLDRASHIGLGSDRVGLNDPSDEEIAAGNYEMYDPRLAEQLRNLYGQYENEAEMVARLRREVPRQAAVSYAETLMQQLALERQIDSTISPATDLLKVRLDRQDQVRKTWENALSSLQDLHDVPQTISKLERAVQVAEAVKSL